jgi:signal recognition particle GTPase
MSIENYYTDITILHNTKMSNGMGGFKDTWSELETIRGIINADNDKTSLKDILIANQVGVVATHALYSDISENLTSNNRIKDSNNRIYRIIGIYKNTINRNHHAKTLLEYDSIDS